MTLSFSMLIVINLECYFCFIQLIDFKHEISDFDFLRKIKKPRFSKTLSAIWKRRKFGEACYLDTVYGCRASHEGSARSLGLRTNV